MSKIFSTNVARMNVSFLVALALLALISFVPGGVTAATTITPDTFLDDDHPRHFLGRHHAQRQLYAP